MGVIVNPRGTGGSGKTELVRRILADYGWGGGGRVEPIRREGRAADRPPPSHPLGGRPLAVLGHYGAAACGGCDTIPARDGGPDEAFRLADGLAAAGHDVLLEGLFLSGEHRRAAELARRHALHVLRLDTPLERCVRSLAARRRAGRAVQPLIARTVAAQRDAVEDACARLRGCAASVEGLDFDGALRRARELLGLRPAATDGGPWKWPTGIAAAFGDAAATADWPSGEPPGAGPMTTAPRLLALAAAAVSAGLSATQPLAGRGPTAAERPRVDAAPRALGFGRRGGVELEGDAWEFDDVWEFDDARPPDGTECDLGLAPRPPGSSSARRAERRAGPAPLPAGKGCAPAAESRMGVPVATERRVLTEAEFEAVARTRHPEVRGLPKEELIGLARRLRECRDEARDIARHRRRGRRGEAEPRGATPAPGGADTSMRERILASALRRVNREIGRVERDERRDVATEDD